jgi:hypothetical protein
MNESIAGPGAVMIALIGRVPTKVVGPIKRGDLIGASRNYFGCASVGEGGGLVGRALADYNSQSPGVIEVLVGRY